jgi:hypothetical protein
VGQVAYAIAIAGSFPGQIKNPIARAFRNSKKPPVPGYLEGVHVGVADQTRPDNNWIVVGVPTTTGNKIKMIAPAVVLEAWHLIYVEPFQATPRLL